MIVNKAVAIALSYREALVSQRVKIPLISFKYAKIIVFPRKEDSNTK